MFKRRLRSTCALVLISMSLSVSTAQADWSQSLQIGVSDNGFGLPLSASVLLEFETSTGELTVTLDNSTFNPRAMNQNLSGLYLTFNTGESTGTLLDSFGIERTVDKYGVYADGSMVATDWSLFDDVVDPLFGTTGVHLNLLGTSKAPNHTIVGLPDGNDIYSAANTSIKGNGPHNPYLGESATFVLNIDGLSDLSRASRATFQFNTAAGTYFGVPEPSWLVPIAIGLIGFISCCRRRQPVRMPA